MGAEFRALSELVGGRGKALDLYQLVRDSHSSFDIATREYSFMTIGPVSSLSFAGTPLFFNAFKRVSDNSFACPDTDTSSRLSPISGGDSSINLT
jgi:hypothetical protein